MAITVADFVALRQGIERELSSHQAEFETKVAPLRAQFEAKIAPLRAQLEAISVLESRFKGNSKVTPTNLPNVLENISARIESHEKVTFAKSVRDAVQRFSDNEFMVVHIESAMRAKGIEMPEKIGRAHV